MNTRTIIIIIVIIAITHGTVRADAESNALAATGAVLFNGIGLLGNTRALMKGERYIPVAVYGIIVGTITMYAAEANADWENERSSAHYIVIGIGATSVLLSIANLMQGSPKKENSDQAASERNITFYPTVHVDEGVISGGGLQVKYSF